MLTILLSLSKFLSSADTGTNFQSETLMKSHTERNKKTEKGEGNEKNGCLTYH